jgi:hypothetical protein
VTKDAQGKTWRSRLTFRANGAGTVDTRSNMRLFWSMQPLGANGDLGMVPSAASSVVISVESGGA